MINRVRLGGFNFMTEQVVKARTGLAVSAGSGRAGRADVSMLPESAHILLEKRGFHFLRPKTLVLVRAEFSGTNQRHHFHMKPVELTEGVEVTLARYPIVHPGLPEGLTPLVVVPDSDARRDAMEDLELAVVRKYDYAAAEDSFWALRREEARLARNVVAGVKDIALEKVTRVQLTTAVI